MLIELAERCEAATGPDRELDFWIGTRLEGTHHTDAELQADIDTLGIDGMHIPAAYTALLDAAMTLVPPFNRPRQGSRISIDVWDTNGVYPEHVRASAWVFGAPRTYAATPALALCAAALRALAAGSGSKGNAQGSIA